LLCAGLANGAAHTHLSVIRIPEQGRFRISGFELFPAHRAAAAATRIFFTMYRITKRGSVGPFTLAFDRIVVALGVGIACSLAIAGALSAGTLSP
jgi:hypothetical protein